MRMRAAAAAIPIALAVSAAAWAASPTPSPASPAAAASGTPDPELAARLAETQKRLDEMSRNLAAATEKEKALLAAIDELDHEIADKQDDIQHIAADVEAKRARADEDRAMMEEIRARISKKKRWLAGRVRSAFIHGRPGYLKVLFSAESYPELIRRTRFQGIVARRDAQMVGELKRDLEEVARHRSDYDQDLALLTEMESDARAKTEELALERKFRQGLLDRIEAEKAGYEKMTAALSAQADRLASQVGSLQGGSTEVVAPHATRPFADAKGLLSPPVRAKVKLAFGPYIHPKLHLRMRNDGFTYELPVGSHVHAIADGTVEMARWFSGYGLLLIIDHGDGWRSLYAHNSKILAAEGATVREGDVVAESGDTGSLTGPELFFAIFREGKPVDPGEWVSAGKKTALPSPSPAPPAPPSTLSSASSPTPTPTPAPAPGP